MKTLLKVVIGIVVVFVLAVGAVFFLTAGMASTADDFFRAVKGQDFAAARSHLSEDFKASTDEAALREFFTKGALLNFKDTSWSNRQISGGRGELDGEVITEKGGVVPLKLMFVKENGDWKIYGIQKPTAGLQAEQSESSSPTVPSSADRVALVKRSMHDFAVSVNSKSMEHFRSTVSQVWQKQFTTEKLNEAFGPLVKADVDLTVLDRIEPIVEPVAALEESGMLILKGRFPSSPSQTFFEQKYIYEGLGWKLIGFQINIK